MFLDLAVPSRAWKILLLQLSGWPASLRSNVVTPQGTHATCFSGPSSETMLDYMLASNGLVSLVTLRSQERPPTLRGGVHSASAMSANAWLLGVKIDTTEPELLRGDPSPPLDTSVPAVRPRRSDACVLLGRWHMRGE